MFRFFAALTLAVVSLPLAWAALLKTPDYQSPTLEPPAVANSDPATPVQLTTTGEMLVNADWFDLIFRGAGQDNEPAPRPRYDDRPKRTTGTYRTLCVRLCDGFYFPTSYSTSRARFAGDAKQCEQRCPSRSRLFVHRNPGEDVDDMVDLQGRGYRNLPTAFLHRTRHVADCTCRGHPWDEAPIARHRAYAETARQKVAGKTPDKPPMTQTRSLRDQHRWARSE